MNVQLIEQPYPYFIHDNTLPPELIMDMRRNWPGQGSFRGEIPGNYVCDLKPFMNEGFWQAFTQQVLPQIVVPALAAFADWIEARYPGVTTFDIPLYGLMQAQGNYGGHDVHNHHYHDPTWVATLLLYLDAESTGHQGTSLLRSKPDLDPASAAAQTLHWPDLTEEAVTVEYRQGRLFAMHDNAIAYHGVKASGPGAVFGRRILRMHVSAPTSHCERLYGVDYKTYQKMRLVPTKDARVIQWMQRDIDQLRQTRLAMTPEQRNAWAQRVRLSI